MLPRHCPVTVSNQKQQPLTEWDGWRQEGEPFKVTQDHKAQCARAELELCCWIYEVKTPDQAFLVHCAACLCESPDVPVCVLLFGQLLTSTPWLAKLDDVSFVAMCREWHETPSRGQSIYDWVLLLGSRASRSNVCNSELRRAVLWLKWQESSWI